MVSHRKGLWAVKNEELCLEKVSILFLFCAVCRTENPNIFIFLTFKEKMKMERQKLELLLEKGREAL